MPTWSLILLGLGGGTAAIGAAIYIAFRPYLAGRAPKARMPEQRERTDEGSITAVTPLSSHDFSS